MRCHGREMGATPSGTQLSVRTTDGTLLCVLCSWARPSPSGADRQPRATDRDAQRAASWLLCVKGLNLSFLCCRDERNSHVLSSAGGRGEAPHAWVGVATGRVTH